ncbi:hypothetical protein [Actinacidiphila yeochonensis]|uniref:hypothetical protein n=1 Tax=Actinacidiphila yeochonensis TaxID=89050 RepID=UPI00055AFA46|nr:hypothetical protein [Actinacidiphila yeochonensis]
MTGITCARGASHKAVATVVVRYDGSAAGTLRLTWWRGATRNPQGAATTAQQTATFPKGATSYTLTDTYTFTSGVGRTYVGLTVSSAPAAAAGESSMAVDCR